MEIKNALLWGQKELQKSKIPQPALEAEILLEKTLKTSKEDIYKNLEKKLSLSSFKKYQNLIQKRQKGIPLFYIVGEKEFFALNFWVKPKVFIPRHETEILVEEALKDIKTNFKNEEMKIVDVGTGSGCIAISLAKNLDLKNKKYKIYAIDISQKALNLALQNAQRHKVENKIHFLKGNLLLPLIKKGSQGSFFIVANLPYVKNEDFNHLPLSSIKYEPKRAFWGGKDGVLYYKRLFQQIKKWKVDFKEILIEIDPKIKKEIKTTARQILKNIEISFQKDLTGKTRIAKIYPKQN